MFFTARYWTSAQSSIMEYSMLKRSLVCVLATTTVLLSACGGSSVDAALDLAKPTGLLAVVDNTTASKSSKVDMKLTVDLGIGGQTQHLTMTGTGAFDYEHNKGRLSTSLPASGLLQAMNMEEVIDGSTLYMKVTDANGKALSAKPWVKLDLTHQARQSGIDLDSLGMQQANPAQYLDMLRGGADDVTKVGTETLHGTKTTHYAMQVDFAKAAQSASSDQKQAFDKLSQLYSKPVPVEIWVDSDDMLRKLVLTLDMSSLGDSSGVSVSGSTRIEEELYDFGTPVNVDVPPADQVLSS
jgi:hypothetical protein